MSVVRNLFDGLTNALSGAGTATDPRSYNSYTFRRLTDPEIERAYRGGWVMRKIIDKPATEMVREWRDWQADKADVALIEKLERKLDLRNKIKRAEILRGLGGAGMVIYNGDVDLTAPIDPTKVKAGALVSVHVWHRSRFTLGQMITDPRDPWCGHPSFYQLNAVGGVQTKLHPSRVVAFRGDSVPDMATVTWNDSWWGDSKVQTVLDAVQNSDTAQNGFAALIKDSRNRRLAVPGLTERLATTAGEAQFQKRVQALAMGESMFGVTFLDAGGADGKGGETLTDRQMVWAGIPDIAAMYLAAAAGAADMPATILLGKSPDGMNATGDGDRLIWENTIKARQDLDLRPALDQLDVVLIPSALGRIDDSIWYQFAPLSTLNEMDEATAFWNTMQAVAIVQTTGTIPAVALDKGVQNLLTERGWVPGLDAALAEIPDGERFPSEIAEEKPDPDALEGGDPVSEGAGAGMEAPLRRAANDAAPRPLYVRRDLVNVADLAAWAKAQGLPALNDDLHVTIAFSRTPVDWIAMGADYRDADGKGGFTIGAGGPRLVEPLGNQTAVLLFASSDLGWRHMSMRENGASWDFPEYQPHISLTDQPCDLSAVEPYRGKIVLGPEIFEALDTD